ncbi:lipopolysaccharide assembly protein LapA domain-containing protein [Thermoproteota archaeon]
MKIKAILITIAVSLFLVILLQNTEVVSVRFLFWQVGMSRIILLPLILLAGVLIGFFIGRKSWDW